MRRKRASTKPKPKPKPNDVRKIQVAKKKFDVFISYRRLDSAVFSQWLATQLRNAYGPQCVFIDTDNIREGEVWSEKCGPSLSDASILIVVVGKSWLSIKHEHKRRRIDREDDWVRLEIETSLREGKTILPLLIDGANTPTGDAVPRSIAGLLAIQARRINPEKIAKDILELVNDIGTRLGKKPVSTVVKYPTPLLKIQPLSQENLQRLEIKLPAWRVVTRPGDSGEKTGLLRTYEFQSFDDAIHFMNTSARFIDRIDHHPEWTNIWRALVVFLTTWDISHPTSMLD